MEFLCERLLSLTSVKAFRMVLIYFATSMTKWFLLISALQIWSKVKKLWVWEQIFKSHLQLFVNMKLKNVINIHVSTVFNFNICAYFMFLFINICKLVSLIALAFMRDSVYQRCHPIELVSIHISKQSVSVIICNRISILCGRNS